MHSPLRPHVAGNHLAGGDTDAGLEPHPGHRRNLELCHGALDGERRADRALRIVRTAERGAKEGKYPVAEEVRHGASLGLDGIAHHGEVPIEHVQRLLRRMFRGKGGVATHVGEERGHVATVSA